MFMTTAVKDHSFIDNSCKFHGAAGNYEVWFLTLNDPTTGAGFWFRYALDGMEKDGTMVPSVWGSFFDPENGDHFGIKCDFEARRWRDSDNQSGLIAAIGENTLQLDRLTGSLEYPGHTISWDLQFEPAEKTFHHIDEQAKKLLKPKTEICAPNLAVEFSGQVKVDGKTYLLYRAPGCQQHIWGRKHAEKWTWVHCNAFNENIDTVFEAIAASPKAGFITMPPLTLAYLRHDGREYHFNRIKHFFSATNKVGEYSWQFKMGDKNTRITGEASTRPERMLQVEYLDPDGESSFCINSEISILSIKLETRARRGAPWQTVAQLSSNGMAHFEIGSRRAHPAVPFIWEKR